MCGGGHGRGPGRSPLDPGLEKFPVIFSSEVGLVLWDILEPEWEPFPAKGHVDV